MKLSVLLTFIILTSCFQSKTQTENTETIVSNYYFIRHAEKDESDASNKNPHLTTKGLEHAENWSKILSNESFDLVYSTDYHRTRETANPIAYKNGIKISIYNPSDIHYDSFLKKTKGKKVLVVGHSNTTPVFVNNLIRTKKYEDIDHDNYGNLYIVTIINGKASSQLLNFN